MRVDQNPCNVKVARDCCRELFAAAPAMPHWVSLLRFTADSGCMWHALFRIKVPVSESTLQQKEWYHGTAREYVQRSTV